MAKTKKFSYEDLQEIISRLGTSRARTHGHLLNARDLLESCVNGAVDVSVIRQRVALALRELDLAQREDRSAQ